MRAEMSSQQSALLLDAKVELSMLKAEAIQQGNIQHVSKEKKGLLKLSYAYWTVLVAEQAALGVTLHRDTYRVALYFGTEPIAINDLLPPRKDYSSCHTRTGQY